MDTVTVYRVEHPITGLGPYHPIKEDGPFTQLQNDMMDEHDYDGENHPSPFCEGLYTSPSYFCGFLMVQDLHKWFGEFLPGLLELGYEIREYVVPEEYVELGNVQLTFFKGMSIRSSRV